MICCCSYVVVCTLLFCLSPSTSPDPCLPSTMVPSDVFVGFLCLFALTMCIVSYKYCRQTETMLQKPKVQVVMQVVVQKPKVQVVVQVVVQKPKVQTVMLHGIHQGPWQILIHPLQIYPWNSTWRQTKAAFTDQQPRNQRWTRLSSAVQWRRMPSRRMPSRRRMASSTRFHTTCPCCLCMFACLFAGVDFDVCC